MFLAAYAGPLTAGRCTVVAYQQLSEPEQQHLHQTGKATKESRRWLAADRCPQLIAIRLFVHPHFRFRDNRSEASLTGRHYPTDVRRMCFFRGIFTFEAAMYGQPDGK